MALHTNLKLALVLTLTLLGPGACNNQKVEQLEEEEALIDSQSDATPTRDNRNQSGDAAFIKIFPDGDIVPTRGESATVSAPAASTTQNSSTADTGSVASTDASGPAPSANLEESTASNPAQPTSSSPAEVTAAPESQTTTPADDTPQPALEPIAANEPAPAAASEEPTPHKEVDDTTRPVLALNESTAASIISVLPKENKSIVAIGKHSEFAPGPYMILAKWTNDSKKVKVNVTSEEAKEKNCAIDESATQGEWKTLGVFYLTKNAKVVITNGKNSSYAVKNELLLKPVIAENLSSPSKFKCLGGQIDGHGLVGFP